MEYKDVDETWQNRIGQLAARYESELVALALSSKEQNAQLVAEIERLTSELEEAKKQTAGTSDPPN